MTDQQQVEALTSTASLLAKLATNQDGPGVGAARRLAEPQQLADGLRARDAAEAVVGDRCAFLSPICAAS